MVSGHVVLISHGIGPWYCNRITKSLDPQHNNPKHRWPTVLMNHGIGPWYYDFLPSSPSLPPSLYLSLLGIGPWYYKKGYLEINNIHGKYS